MHRLCVLGLTVFRYVCLCAHVIKKKFKCFLSRIVPQLLRLEFLVRLSFNIFSCIRYFYRLYKYTNNIGYLL